jgi:hypothetical protein
MKFHLLAVAAVAFHVSHASAQVCPTSPVNVAVALGKEAVPVIDGDKSDQSWSSAIQIPMFKASRSDKAVLGYGA